MKRVLAPLLMLLAGSALAQQPPASMYPAPPPEKAPVTQQGAPLSGLSSPLDHQTPRVQRTEINAESEAQLFATASKLVWGRYAKVKGSKPGEIAITQTQGLWRIKGRIENEGDWATIEGTVERISAGHVQVRGEAAFRVAKVNGTPCKVAGVLNLRRSGKSQTWRLAEGDNPCDGTREMLDLVMDKPAAPTPRRS